MHFIRGAILGCLKKFLRIVFASIVLAVVFSNLKKTDKNSTPVKVSASNSTSTQLKYEIIEIERDLPRKCSYYIRVDFVDGNLPSEKALEEIARDIQKKSPTPSKTGVFFYMPGENHKTVAWATGHNFSNFEVRVIRKPEPPEIANRVKLGLTLQQRKRLYFEVLRLETDTLPTMEDLKDPSKQSKVREMNRKGEVGKESIIKKYGVLESEYPTLLMESYNNQWDNPARSELDALINSIPAPPKKLEYRVWTDKSGKFKVDAKFISETDSEVHLHRKSGEDISVKKDVLSDADVHWLKVNIGKQ